MENNTNIVEDKNQILIEKIINILYLSGEEISLFKIADILKEDKDIILAIMPLVVDKINTIGLSILNNNDKYIITTNSKYSDLLNDWTTIEYSGDLTVAALQTITIIAYLGESSENDIAFIRGVNSTQIIRNLSTRGLVEKSNNKYKLTNKSLQLLGVTDISQLPEKDELTEKINIKLKDNLLA
ncbi:MAG: SMC-Scp complex subunit ScpB [Cyanobium sp. MAG06]|nr:SMC-Scp complex subunit ScpB [Cyanobium sp. MAG06]